MPEAFIVDVMPTPRVVGKVGEGALSRVRPEHLTAAVSRAITERA